MLATNIGTLVLVSADEAGSAWTLMLDGAEVRPMPERGEILGPKSPLHHFNTARPGTCAGNALLSLCDVPEPMRVSLPSKTGPTPSNSTRLGAESFRFPTPSTNHFSKICDNNVFFFGALGLEPDSVCSIQRSRVSLWPWQRQSRCGRQDNQEDEC